MKTKRIGAPRLVLYPTCHEGGGGERPRAEGPEAPGLLARGLAVCIDMAIYVSVVWALLAVVYAAHPFPPAVMRPLAAVAYLAVAVWHEVRAIRR